MKAGDIPKDAFPIVIKSNNPDEPPIVWAGHISIVLGRRKEADGAGREYAAQGS